MKPKIYTKVDILEILKEAEVGISADEVCRRHGLLKEVHHLH
jgi:hypothetical protein